MQPHYHHSILPSHNRFTNPAVAGRVAVTRSSDESGQASDLVGRADVTSYTDRNQGLGWWRVDFGATRRVAPTKYTLKHGRNHGDYRLRNWVLEGSLDGQAPWTTLRTHANDLLLPNEGYSTASWDMDADYAGNPTPVRFLKVRMTDSNSRAPGVDHNNDSLCLSGLEVYGALQIVESAAHLRTEGKTLAELKALGYLPGELKAVGFTVAEMCDGGLTRSDFS